MNRKFIVALALVFASSFSHAERSVEAVYKECGLGGWLFGNVHGVLAITSNITWDLGTTAATSDATDACNDNIRTTAAVLIKETYDVLESEIAVGHGQHLSALTSLMNCEGKTVELVIGEIRQSMSSMSAQDREAKVEELFSAVSPNLAVESSKACSVS